MQIRRRPIDQEVTLDPQLHPVLARVYLSRGITSSDELSLDLASLHHFKRLKGMDQAVELLVDVLQTQQRLLIIGDYDADGATSSALAVSTLRSMGFAHVHYVVPDRFTLGYGLTPALVDMARSHQPDVLMTVDNGISSVAGVETAHQYGIKVLITDHHLAGSQLPAAEAIVNPNQPGCVFPSKCLAGVGVVFYVLMALRARLREMDWFQQHGIPEPNLAQGLDLVALGTMADVVPLDQNNRILVHHGLKLIRRGQARLGIQALLEIAKRELEDVKANDLSFAVGPRLNAAGRLQDMSVGIECLLAADWHRARQLAQTLDELNRERRVLQTDMNHQALAQLETNLKKQSHLPRGLCLYDARWHQGIIGILAGRLKESTKRPVIAFAPGQPGELKGSGRSIKNLNLRDLLAYMDNQHPQLIEKFGGHAMAAGLSIREEYFEQFQRLFEQYTYEWLTEDDLEDHVWSDGALSSEELTLGFATMLERAGPWGHHFPEPLFDGVFNVLDQRLVGQCHLKLLLQDIHTQSTLEAIAFFVDLKEWPKPHCQKIHVAYQLDVQTFQERRRLQLIVRHLFAVNEKKEVCFA